MALLFSLFGQIDIIDFIIRKFIIVDFITWFGIYHAKSDFYLSCIINHHHTNQSARKECSAVFTKAQEIDILYTLYILHIDILYNLPELSS